MNNLHSSKSGLVVDEDSYKLYYPELSKQYSYAQFCGNGCIEVGTNIIGHQSIIDPKGNEWVVTNSVDIDLMKFMYKGEPVFLKSEDGSLFKCSSVHLYGDIYVSCEFGCVTITKMPLNKINDSKSHVVTLPFECITEGELYEELKEALKPRDDDVTVITMIKEYLLEEIIDDGTV